MFISLTLLLIFILYYQDWFALTAIIYAMSINKDVSKV